jgi:hypothetical protein
MQLDVVLSVVDGYAVNVPLSIHRRRMGTFKVPL